MVDKIFNMYDLIFCITNTENLINNEVSNHNRKVAYLSFRIAERLGFSLEQQRDVLLAGLMHDVGVFSFRDKLALIDNEDIEGVHKHAFIGASVLEGYLPLKDIANIIRYHHIPWQKSKGRRFNGLMVPLASHIVHLADRIVVMIKRDQDILGQIKNICEKVKTQSGDVFSPELVDAFLEISDKEYVWLDIVYEPLMTIMPSIMNFETIELGVDEAISLSRVFSNIIDFRSSFTANHSAGVAAVAQKLAELSGFSEKECKMMLIAGYLHDLGKLAVSKEILEKLDKLDAEEYNSIKSHTFYTFRTLQTIKSFETINKWASYHHERMDGRGYPFHLRAESLPLGSRIMAVADVVTAITENRPYRIGMEHNQAVTVIKNLVSNGGLDPYTVDILLDNFELVNDTRHAAQILSEKQYRKLNEINI